MTVEFRFEAAHALPYYNGICRNLHGHGYKLSVSVCGEIDPESGMVADFEWLKKVVQEKVLSRIDHTNLNHLLDNPTAEHLIVWIWNELKKDVSILSELRLYETDNCYVTYRGGEYV